MLSHQGRILDISHMPNASRISPSEAEHHLQLKRRYFQLEFCSPCSTPYAMLRMFNNQHLVFESVIEKASSDHLPGTAVILTKTSLNDIVSLKTNCI
jgi:hypothetical protein